MKKRIYLNEFNVLMNNAIYFPFASGLLRAYAEKDKIIKDNYEFMPFVYKRESINNILEKYENPYIAAFSVSMWNEQLSLKVAEEVKKRWSQCYIVFGGCQAKNSYPFIDKIIFGDGEEKFRNFLLGQSRNEKIEDLDSIPSPYLLGYYDYLLKENPKIDFQAIIETDRGCPFSCSYCFWGKGEEKKYRFHSLERVRQEIDWCGRNKIKYVFNANSNFGIHERDIEIARILKDTKKEYGYPEKFRSCFTKNAEERIFKIGEILHSNELEKGITLSFQSLDKKTLMNVRRRNINLDVYKNLIKRFNEKNIPVYTELIIGLPGETLGSFKKGVDSLFESGFSGQLFCYFCEVYPNTELSEIEYKRKHKIYTQKIKLTPTHSLIQNEEIQEYQEIIIATATMPVSDWKKMWKYAWLAMLMKSLKIEKAFQRYGFGLIRDELAEWDKHLNNMLKGEGKGVKLERFGNIWWDVEEASYLRIMERYKHIPDKIEFGKALLFGRKSNRIEEI